MESILYLFVGLEGHGKLVPMMWIAVVFAFISLVLLIIPGLRRKEGFLAVACGSVIIATWIDKGFGLIVGGFIPDPFNKVFEYWPTVPEVLISVGIWALGFFVITVLYKIAASVKEEIAA